MVACFQQSKRGTPLRVSLFWWVRLELNQRCFRCHGFTDRCDRQLRALTHMAESAELESDTVRCDPLSQMRFSCSRRSNKGQIAVRIDRAQGGQCPDPVQVSAFQQRKVKVFNGFRRLFRQPSQFGAVDKVVDKSEVFQYSIFSTCAI